VPTQVEFRTEFKTTVGKILRRELVREHKEMSAPPKEVSDEDVIV
jgi:hypothetical protein